MTESPHARTVCEDGENFIAWDTFLLSEANSHLGKGMCSANADTGDAPDQGAD